MSKKQTNKQLRDTIFDGPTSKPDCQILEVDGQKFELRAPTMRKIREWSALEGEASVSDIVIGQVFNPDTGEPVFDESSRKMIEDLPVSSPVKDMAEIIGELANKDLTGNEESTEDKK